MMKKLITLLLAALCTLQIWAVTSVINGINYDLSYNPPYTAEVVKLSSGTYSGSVVIPDTIVYNNIKYTVTSIGTSAFESCTNLTSVTIPESVQLIRHYAFYRCSNLTSVHISSIAAWCNIIFGNRSSNPLSLTHSLFLNDQEITNLVIPNSVTAIKDYAFLGYSNLTTVSIPESVLSIGKSAFDGCSGLTSVTVPNSVTSIGSYAFGNCYNLASVTIPASVTSIESCAFHSSGLTSVTIPNSMTSIEGSTFGYCTQLTSVTIPNSVTSIKSCAFDHCTALDSLHISDIAAWCRMEFEWPESGSLVGGVDAASANPMYYARHLCVNNVEVVNVVFPDSITSISDYAFMNCEGIKSYTCEAMTPPACGNYSFYYLDKSIPLFVPCGSMADYRAAEGWKSFTTIRAIEENCEESGPFAITVSDITSSQVSVAVIPESSTPYWWSIITKSNYDSIVAGESFGSIANLTNEYLRVYGDGILSTGNDAYTYAELLPNTEYVVYAIAVDVSTLQAVGDPVISIFTTLASAPNQCGNNLYWAIQNDTLTITGTGAMYDYDRDASPAPWKTEAFRSLSLPDELTSIGSYAFDGCTGITSITIPKAVKSISWSSFLGCTNVTSVIWNAENYRDGSGSQALQGIRYYVNSFVFGDNVKTISRNLCYGMYNLTSITIPSSVTDIDSYAFSHCSGLTSIVVDPGNRVYDSRNNCNAIIETATNTLVIGCKESVLLESIAGIGDNAFYGCETLSSVTIPQSITSIGVLAFAYCSGLSSVTSLSIVPPVCSEYAFYDVDSTIPVYVPANSVSAYQSAEGWNTFTNFISIDMNWIINIESDGLGYFVSANAEVYDDSLIIDSVRLEISTNDTLWMPLTGDLVVVDGSYISAEIPFTALRPGTYRIRAVAMGGGESYVSESKTMEIGGRVIVDEQSVTEGSVLYDEAMNVLTISEAEIQSADVAITNMVNDAIIDFAGASMISAIDAGILSSGDVTLQGTYESDYTSVDTTTIVSYRPVCASAEGVKVTFDGVTLHLVVPGHEGDVVPGRAAARRQMSPIARARYIAQTVLLTEDAEGESVISGFDEADFINCGVIEPEGAEYDEDNLELMDDGGPVYNCTIVPMDTPDAIEKVTDTMAQPCLKLLRNGQVLIQRGGCLYDLRGQEVR